MPIRVLNVVGRMDRGGIETFIMNVYRNIDRSKVQFDFLAHYGKVDADYNEEIHALGGRIYEMPIIKTTQKTYYSRFFEYRNALKNFFSEHQEYRILHGHMTNTAAIYMPIAKKYGKISCCIAHSHLSQAQKTNSPLAIFVTEILRKPIRYYATDYFACSSLAASWLFNKSDITSNKVKIVLNGIDCKQLAYSEEKRLEMREKLKVSNKEVLGHVGRFFPPKNHEFLIDIFKEYHNAHKSSVLVLVGDGELKPIIVEKVKQLGLIDSVLFLGVRQDVPDLLQAMDLFLLPSLYEGLPVVGIEAQAAGLPVFVSDTVTKELNVTDNVWFIDLKESPKEWAELISQKVCDFKRRNTAEALETRGYDILETAKFLQDFYISKHFSRI